MPVKSATTWNAAREENDAMNQPKKRTSAASKTPKFTNEDEEARWWAGTEGRGFLKRQSGVGTKKKGSPLVSALSRARTVQIALRLPAPDLAKAREIAGRWIAGLGIVQ